MTWRRALISLALFGALVAGGLVVLTGTETGTRALIGIATRVARDAFQIDAVGGRLTDEVTLTGIRSRSKRYDFRCGTLVIRLELPGLLTGAVNIDALRLAQVSFRDLGADPEPSEPFEPPRIAVQVRDVVLEDLRFFAADASQPTVRIGQISAAAAMDRKGRITVERVSVQADRGNLTLAGTAALGAVPEAALQVQWALRDAKSTALSGGGTVAVTASTVHIAQRIRTPMLAEVYGRLEYGGATLPWSARIAFPGRQPLPAGMSGVARTVSGLVDLNGTGTLLQARADLTLAGAAAERISMVARASGDARRELRIDQFEVNGPDAARIHLVGKLNEPMSSARRLALDGDWRALRWPLAAEPSFASPEGRLSVRGTPEDYSLTVHARTALPAALAGRWTAQGRGNARGLTLTALDAALGDGRIEARGLLAWSPTVTADLGVSWRNLAHRLADQRWVRSASGTAKLRVAERIADVEAKFALATDGLPPGSVSASATYDRGAQTLNVTDGLIGVGVGEMRLNVAADLKAPSRPWTASAVARDFDPGIFSARWPGRIDADIKLRGEGKSVAVQVDHAQGSLRERPFEAEADLEVRPGQYWINRLRLHAGRARIGVAPKSDAAHERAWSIEVPNLDDLWPAARGSVHGKGTLIGRRAINGIRGRLQARNVKVAGYAAATIDTDVELREGDDEPLRLALNAQALRRAKQTVKRLLLDIKGSRKAHAISATMETAANYAAIDLRGGFAAARAWVGELRGGDLMLNGRPFAASDRAALSVAAGRLTLGQSCWRGDVGEFCLEAQRDPSEDWSARLVAVDLDMDALTPDRVRLDGRLSGHVTARGRAGRVQAVDADLSSNAGSLLLGARPEELWTIPYRKLRAGVTTADQTATLTVGLDPDLPAAATALMTLAVSLPALQDAQWSEVPVQARLHGRIDDLSLFAEVLPNMLLGAGAVNVDLAGSGTAAEIAWDGQAELTVDQAQLLTFGTQIRELNLAVRGAGGQRMTIDGTVKSGEGDLRINGEVTAKGVSDWRASIAIDGERFEAVNLPELYALVSPEIKVDVDPKAVTVTGTVDIPEARITPRDIRNRISPSPDVVLVGESESENGAGNVRAVNSDVRLRLGEAVSFDVRGFTGRLVGEIRAVDQPGQGTTGLGEIRIVDGAFSAYGQSLELETGRLVFAGGPIDDPSVSARALRRIGDVTVGIRASGRVRNPVLDLFSTPKLSDSEVLSYLVLGRSFRQASSADGQTLLGAATSMGLSGSRKITGQVASAFKLDEFAMSHDPTTRSLTVNVGKYLSPKLYVGYALGVLDQTNTVRMRYHVNETWSVEAEQGAGSGADVLYNIER